MIGGGIYFRGRMADGWGIGRAEADNIGMLRTVSALVLANEQNLTMHGFDVAATGVMRRICEGENLDTLVKPNSTSDRAGARAS